MRTKTKPVHVRDLIDEDARVICTEGFRPLMYRLVERGEYFELSDQIVRQYPQFFAAVLPVDTVLGEIER
jgi:hypothetical protein